MKYQFGAIRHELGGLFTDYENTYAASGADWWSISYKPLYPENSVGDLIAYGCPSKNNFQLIAPNLGKIAVAKRFCTFSDLCDCIAGKDIKSLDD